MSKRAIPTFFSWRSSFQKSDLPATTKLVLFCISTYMNEHGTGCFPSIKTLMIDASLSNRAVITHIQKASEAGFLNVSQHGYSGQKWKRNEYSISFPVTRSIDDIPLTLPASEEDKLKAQKAIGNDLYNKKISKEPCYICGKTDDIQAHHYDYSKKRNVFWLCRKHHTELHVAEKRGERHSKRGEPDDIDVVNEVHTNTPSNTPKNIKYIKDFEELFIAYGKVGNRKLSMAKYQIARRTVDQETLLKAIKLYDAHLKAEDWKQKRSLQAWLHQEGWTEEWQVKPVRKSWMM